MMVHMTNAGQDGEGRDIVLVGFTKGVRVGALVGLVVNGELGGGKHDTMKMSGSLHMVDEC
jgi:hypothetical protein